MAALRLARMRRERGSVGVVLPARSRRDQPREERMRVIGLDIHRVFAEAAALEDGRWSGSAGSISSGTGWRGSPAR